VVGLGFDVDFIIFLLGCCLVVQYQCNWWPGKLVSEVTY